MTKNNMNNRALKLKKVVKCLEKALNAELLKKKTIRTLGLQTDIDALEKKQRALDRLSRIPETKRSTKQLEKMECLSESVFKDREVLEGKRDAMELKLSKELKERLKTRQCAKRSMLDELTLSRMLEYLIDRCKEEGMRNIKQLMDAGRSVSFIKNKELKLAKQQGGCFIKHSGCRGKQ